MARVWLKSGVTYKRFLSYSDKEATQESPPLPTHWGRSLLLANCSSEPQGGSSLP